MNQVTFDPSAVYTRTAAGQQEAISDVKGISDNELRLLLMVNGYTSASHLLLLAPDIEEADALLARLYAMGLIDVVR